VGDRGGKSFPRSFATLVSLAKKQRLQQQKAKERKKKKKERKKKEKKNKNKNDNETRNLKLLLEIFFRYLFKIILISRTRLVSNSSLF